MKPKLSGAARHRASAIGLAAATALVGLASSSCSVLPARGFPPTEEREVVARYRFGAGGAAPVRVPASRPGLTVLSLRTEPPDLRETFAGGQRYLLPTGDSLEVHCRYRITGSADGFADPTELFPGATAVQTLRQRPD